MQGVVNCDASAEIGFRQIVGLREFFSVSFKRKATEPQDISPLRRLQRHSSVLLDKQDRQAGFVQALNEIEDFSNEQRTKTK
jgi:hypothetical protein